MILAESLLTTGCFRVKDWLYGVRPAAPDKETQRSLDKEPLTEAERLRIVYQLITLPQGEGGAGITPKQGPWTLVESIFPLHDHEFNKVSAGTPSFRAFVIPPPVLTPQ